MNIDYGTKRFEVVRLGFTSSNAAGSFPNIQYQIALGDVTKNLHIPWVSYPSETDASLDKAAFLFYLKYFEEYPSSLTVTKPAQEPPSAT